MTVTSEPSRMLLIVEDDPALQKQIKWSLDRFHSVTALDRDSALAQVRRHSPAVITMDLGLPPDADSVSEGFHLLEQVLALDPNTKVIVLTGQNDQANALKAVAIGAYDFLAKPFEPEVLNLTVERAFRLHELQRENQRLQALRQPDALDGLITRDPEMLRISRMIEKVAGSTLSVMLLGESGTGKEVLARGLHQSSSRRAGKFIAVNCAAIPENLLESELFGYERGAFTGAAKTTPGRIELANEGTFLLDEIGDLPVVLQSKLLRFLQERSIERIGGRQAIPVDVRVVCATHQDLASRIEQGLFREDLYYRLAEIVIKIPPLRDRTGDAALISHALIGRFAQEQNRGQLSLSEDAVAAIEAHPWHGNVRELASCLKRAVVLADGSRIFARDLGLRQADSSSADTSLDLRAAREAAEQRVVLAALARVNGNIVKAAELLGVSRPTLYDLMSRLNLK